MCSARNMINLRLNVTAICMSTTQHAADKVQLTTIVDKTPETVERLE